MKMSLKFAIVLALGVTVFGTAAHALAESRIGVVKSVWSQINDWGDATDFVQLEGLSAFGTCNVEDGLVKLYVRDDVKGQRMYATALTAFSTGSRVKIWIDDSKVRSSTRDCLIGWIKLGE